MLDLGDDHPTKKKVMAGGLSARRVNPDKSLVVRVIEANKDKSLEY